MNILQRRMFANGDAVSSQPTTLRRAVTDPYAEIANYTLSGYAPIEIFEILQADYLQRGMEIPFGMATIERISQELGGSMKENPKFIGPKIPQDQAKSRIMEITPETVNPNLSADPSSELGRRLRELNPQIQPESLDITEQLNQLGAVENLSNTDVSNVEGKTSGIEGFELLPEGSNDGLPVVEETVSSIKDNQVIIGDRTWTFKDIDKFEQDVKDGMLDGTDLYPILNADGVQRGSEIQRILNKFAEFDEPEIMPGRAAANIMGTAQEDRAGTISAPGDFGSTAQNIALAGVRGGQSLANVGIGGINLLNKAGDYVSDFFQGPDIQGAIKGQRGREAALERENPPVENVFDFIPLTEKRDIAAMRLDQMVGVDSSDTIDKSLEDLSEELQPIPPKSQAEIDTDQQKQDEEAIDKDVKDNSKDPITSKEKEVVEEAAAVAVVAETPQVKQQRMLNNPNFTNLLRNIGISMVETGDIGYGISQGSAQTAKDQMVAEEAERQLRLESELSGSEFAEFLAKEDIKNANKFRDNESNYAEALGQTIFEIESSDAILLAITQAKELVATGDVTGLSPAFQQLVNKAARQLGISVKLAPREIAQNIINDIINGNIKELTGESGRTISNLDREVAKNLVGAIDWKADKENVTAKLDMAYNRAKSKYNSSYMSYQSKLKPYERYGLTPPFKLGTPNIGPDEERIRLKIIN
tara:strand:- start:3089 stop:5194 length:2106 start_codon:yes stop_codon:yes gene_type:complete